MGNPLMSSQFVRLLDKRLREVAENKYKDLPNMRDRLYRMISSDSAWEEFYGVGSIPDIPTFVGKLESLGVAPGYYTRIENKEFAAFIPVERKLLDDKKYGVLDGMAAGLMESANRVQEKYAARPFNYAFSTAYDFMTSEEGVSMCSDSHTTKSGTSTSSGFDNSGTTAMSKSAVAATRLLMKKFKNDISERIDVGDDLAIICPDNLADTAMEIVGTPNGLYTTEHTKNVQYQRHNVIPYSRLDDYDTNNWFMVWESQMKKDLIWLNRIAPEVKFTVDFDTYHAKTAIYMRFANGFIDWRFIYGHAVS